MRLKTFILLLFVFAQCLQAQIIVKGVVYDNSEKKPLEFVSIRALSPDSVAVGGSSTDKQGLFDLKLGSGKYILEASFLGYDMYQTSLDIMQDVQNISLDTIFLLEKSIELDGVSVVGKPPAIVVKGDTIEYSVGSYQASENDALQDIVRKLPGVELDADGNLKANGKPIDRILIDGREFFGNDIARALRDLPANMIQKIQLFKKEKEDTKHTGFKREEDQEQVLNLKVKEDAKKSIFGEIEAGYGTEEKYNVSGNIYQMRDDKQLMARTFVNNLDRRYGGPSFGSNGITENKEFGLTYNGGSRDKLEYETSVNYNDNRNINKTESESQYFLSTGDRFSLGTSGSDSQSKDFSGNVRLRWKPDSLTSVTFSGGLGHSITSSLNESITKSYVTDTTFSKTNSWSDGISDNARFSLNASRRFGLKGRRITFALSGNLRNADEDRSNFSTTTYSSPTESPIVLDQKSSAENKTSGWSTSLTYFEPLSESKTLVIGYSVDKNVSTRDRETLKKDEFEQYTVVDTAYTRLSRNEYLIHKIRTGFREEKEKYNYSIGLDILPQAMKTQVSFRDSIIDNLKQNVVNFSPSLSFSWNPGKSRSLNVNYSGMTEQPRLTQLSSDTTYLGATSKQYGNPNLKTSFSNNVSVNYYNSNSEKERFFNLYSSFNYSVNSIANYSMMDSQGRTESTYRNVSGNMSANLGANYSWKIKKIRLSAYGGTNYSRNKGFVNQQMSIANSYSVNSGLSLSYSHEKVDVFLQGRASTSSTKSNLSSSQDMDVFNWALTNGIVWRMPLDFIFNNSFAYNHSSRISKELPQSNILWNLTLSKSVLKGKKGTLKVDVNNLLNEKNDVQRSVSDSQLSYSRSYSVGRYILFSFAYKLNTMGKKGRTRNSFRR